MPVACISERRMMRIMRSAHEVEAGLFDELHIALDGCPRDTDAPAGMVLMRIGPAKIKMLAVQEKAAVFGEFEEPKAEFRFDWLGTRIVAKYFGPECVKIRMIGMPKSWVRDWGARLVKLVLLIGLQI